ncbi:MAG: hypothetical protein HC802_23095, partial [Caldilineaceae bacterium]|nr:hypothetical protein [Caldilineaceae bacterium]
TFALLAPDESLLGFVLRYLRYATVSAWIGGIAPLLFVRFGLANAASTLVDQPELATTT